jgi:hypothetical protein
MMLTPTTHLPESAGRNKVRPTSCRAAGTMRFDRVARATLVDRFMPLPAG